MQLEIGTFTMTKIMPNTPGQPKRVMSKAVVPIANIGKENALRKVASLIYITPKSLDSRLVIFPNCDDLITYRVRLDILLYNNIARALLIRDAKM
jgi:hypothetical protein